MSLCVYFYVNDVNLQPALVVTFKSTSFLTFSPSQINFSLDDLNMIFSAVSDIQTQKLYLATF